MLAKPQVAADFLARRGFLLALLVEAQWLAAHQHPARALFARGSLMRHQPLVVAAAALVGCHRSAAARLLAALAALATRHCCRSWSVLRQSLVQRTAR
jgi:pantothenate kinase